MRKQIRKPATEHAQKLVIKKLEQMRLQGQDIGSVLEQSVRNSWIDVWPLKTNSNSGGERFGSNQRRRFITDDAERMEACANHV
jgi:hypothetical protein